MNISFEDIGLLVLKTIGIYILILACLRLLGKKGLSELSAVDLVFIIIIGEGMGNLIPENMGFGGVAVYVIALTAANYTIEWLSHKSKKFNEFVEGEPVLLIRNGKMLRKNMDKEKISIDNLKEALRSKGLKHIEQVDLGILETDGGISIIPINIPAMQTSERKSKKM